MRIRINPNIDQIVDLDDLPGGRALYEDLARRFIHHYEGHEGDCCGGSLPIYGHDPRLP